MTHFLRGGQHACLAAMMVLAVFTGCLDARAPTGTPAATGIPVETLRMQLAADATDVDVYWPDTAAQAPMVIIVHGFMRDRHNMSGWGQHLAKEGFVAVVPDLPTHTEHDRNGRFISALLAHLRAGDPWTKRIDVARVGFLGFSAGGLVSLLSAAESPNVAVWVGLDPVDADEMGAKVAPMLQSQAVVLTAEPSACNANGNARGIIAALPSVKHLPIPGAVHVDAEWPSSWMAELACGRTTQAGQDTFRLQATNALHEVLTKR